MTKGLGPSGPSGGSQDPAPSLLGDARNGEGSCLRQTFRSAAPNAGMDEDHLSLYRVFSRQILPL